MKHCRCKKPELRVTALVGFGLSTAVAEVLKLNQHDMLIVSNAFEEWS